MNHEELLELHKGMSQDCYDMMHNKNRDYTPDPDVDALAQFKLIAEIVGITPEQVALVFQATKLIRVASILKHGRHHVVNETPFDTIDDGLNYWVLLRALLEDRKEHETVSTFVTPTQEGEYLAQVRETPNGSRYVDLSGPLSAQPRKEKE